MVETGPKGLKLLGELDLAGVPEVREALARFDGDIAVDCSELTFIDCSGLGMFVLAHQTCEARGVKLVLVNPTACMQKLLRITDLDSALNVQVDGTVR